MGCDQRDRRNPGTCLKPHAPVSRGETAEYFWNMQGRPTAAAHSFTDITKTSQNAAISWLAAEGITTGTSPTTFSPNRTLTRAQVAAFLHRLAGEPPAASHSFSDVRRDWQQSPVSWLASEGITTGTSPTTFSPNRTLTRAQLVTFLYRYMDEPAVTVDPSSPVCGDRSLSGYTQVSAGETHTCAVNSNESISCWGLNNSARPTPRTGGIPQLKQGYGHSCAITTSGTISCWGDNRFGQTNSPAGIFRSVTAGATHSCAIRVNGSITCWGTNNSGQTDAPSGAFRSVSTGETHTCAIQVQGMIRCWGNNDTEQTDSPQGLFTSVAAGSDHTCAIRLNGSVECWGLNNSSQLDAPSGTYKAITSGADYSCAIRDNDNTATCWGADLFGEAQDPTGDYRAITAGRFHTCAITAAGALTCWGDNRSGQATPPQGPYRAIASGAQQSCAIGMDDQVVCGARIERSGTLSRQVHRYQSRHQTSVRNRCRRCRFVLGCKRFWSSRKSARQLSGDRHRQLAQLRTQRRGRGQVLGC